MGDRGGSGDSYVYTEVQDGQEMGNDSPKKYKTLDDSSSSHEQAKRSWGPTGFLVAGWLATSSCTGYLIYEIVTNPGNHELQIVLFGISIILLMASVVYLLQRKLKKDAFAWTVGGLGCLSACSALFGVVGPTAFEIDPSQFEHVHYASTLTSVICAALAIWVLLYGIRRAKFGKDRSGAVLLLHTVSLIVLGSAVSWTFLSDYCLESEIILIWTAIAFVIMLVYSMHSHIDDNNKDLYRSFVIVGTAAVFGSAATGTLVSSADYHNLHIGQGITMVTGGLFALALLWALFGYKSSPVFLIGALSVVAMTTMLSFNIGFVESVFTSGSPWIWVFFGCGCALLGTILYGIRKRVQAFKDKQVY